MEAIKREKLMSLSNTVKKLLEKIVSIQLVDTFRIKNVNASLSKTVKEALADLQDVLHYANNKLIPSQAINKLLDLLRRDLLQLSNLLRQTNLLRYATVLTAKHLKFHSRLTFFIQLIKSRTVNLIRILHGPSSLGDDDSSIYGRDSDIQKLIHLLLSSSSDGDTKTRVISIVGMGGIGKTNLAKHLFNHPQVKDKFELKVWAYISKDFDAVRVFETILESITSQSISNDIVNTLMGPLLPTSLVTLCICGLNDTSIDEKWLQHLTSLQNLEIINAPKLKSLPKKGLPSSLSVLSVTRCPLLEASFQTKRGKEWRKIAHIPSIVINDELIT